MKPVEIMMPKFIMSGLIAMSLSLAACGGGSDTAPQEKADAPVSKPTKKANTSVKATPTTTESTVVTRAVALPADGQKLYKRCAACHMPTGEGVVGAFPPLTGDIEKLLDSELGKEYLVLVVMYGLAGEIEVGGERYFGMMSAQGGMNAEKTSAVLNYIMQSLNDVSDEDARAFTADFVSATKSKYGRLSGSKVHALRADAYKSVMP